MSSLAKKTSLARKEVDAIRKRWLQDPSFLGSSDAERDSEMSGWHDLLFVDSPTFARVANGRARLVVGRKGAGKSASRLYASKAGLDPSAVISVTAADVLLRQRDVFATARDASSGMVPAWYAAFASEILRAIAQKMTGRLVTSASEMQIRKWAIESGIADRDFGERLVAAARALLPKLEFGGDAVSLGIDVGAAVDSLVGSLTAESVQAEFAKKRYVLYVDDFDAVPPNQSVRLVQAAVEAADRLALGAGRPAATLLVREDLWLLCRQNWHYLDKVQSRQTLEWNNKGSPTGWVGGLRPSA